MSWQRLDALLELDVSVQQRRADFAFVGGVGATLVGERCGEVALNLNEVRLGVNHIRRSSGAGLNFFLFSIERLPREIHGGAAAVDAPAGGLELAGGRGD